MDIYTREIAQEFKFPNITIWTIKYNNIVSAYEALTKDGYVMYDPNANDVEFDIETAKEKPVINYYVIKGFPKTYDFNNFPWVAVSRNGVDKNYIFD